MALADDEVRATEEAIATMATGEKAVDGRDLVRGLTTLYFEKVAPLEKWCCDVAAWLGTLGQRVEVLEQREPASGLTINAGDVQVAGLDAVARSVERMERTLAAPVVPQYDEKGVLVGAQRSMTVAPDEQIVAVVRGLVDRSDALAARLKVLEDQINGKDGR